MKKQPTTVYKIVYKRKTIYIGLTNNLTKRQYNHNYNLKKGKKSLLYDFIRELPSDFKIELIPIQEFKKRVDGKRYECFLILKDYFGKKELLNKVPRIRD